jgi:uncharacterized membrane protein YdbT with pleckstrin-like domain
LVLGYVFTLIKSVLALVVYFALQYYVPFLREGLWSGILDIVFLMIMLFIVYTIFLTWVHDYLDTYIITTERVLSIDQIDFFHRRIAEADIGNVQDVKVRVNGVFATFLGFGNVRIQTAGADSSTLWLKDISLPYETKDLILKLSEKNRKLDLHHAYTYRPNIPNEAKSNTQDNKHSDESTPT